MSNIVIPAFKWALIGGLAIIILQTIFMLISVELMGGIWTFIVYLPLIFVMIWGGITIRRENGGDIGFAKSLLAVFIIAATGSLLYNVYVYQLWFKVIDPTFTDRLIELAEEKIRDVADKRGMTDEQVAMQIAFVKGMNFEKWAYIISAVCSVILSLIVAVFVSRPDREQLPTINTES
jgi:hypothetical protein